MQNQSHLAHFHMDGEEAFMDGLAIHENPYWRDIEAADAWHAGWMAAYAASRSMEAASFLDQRS